MCKTIRKTHLFICFSIIYLVLPFTPKTIVAQQADVRLTIMTYNLYRDFPFNTQYSRINDFAEVIKSCDPDLVALQEVRGISNLNKLKKACEMDGKRYNTLPFYGIGILWKSTLGEPKITHKRIKTLKTSSDKEARAYMIAEFTDFYFIATHYSLDKHEQMRMTEEIIQFSKTVSKPIYLAGDFNTTPDGTAILKLRANRFILLNNPKDFTFRSDNPHKIIDMILMYPVGSTSMHIIERGVPDFPMDYLIKLSDLLPYCVRLGM